MDYRSAPRAVPLILVANDVTALDRESGKVVWEYRLQEAARRLLIHEQWVIVLDAGGNLHCLEIASGHRAGLVTTGLRDATAVLFDGERFYVTNDARVMALDWNGRLLWERAVSFAFSQGLGGMALPGLVQQPDVTADGRWPR